MRRFTLETLEPRCLLDAEPMISEFMALNQDTLLDGDGNDSDWVEIYNAGDMPANLAGWHLTDDADDLQKWAFPDVVIGSGGFLVVFASGQAIDDYVDAGGNLHTNFRIRGGGEYLGLIAPDGSAVSEFAPEFPEQREDISYGIGQQVSGDTVVNLGPRFMTNPTPGARNEEGVLGFVEPPRFSEEHGFFGNPFQVEITTDTPEATITFTTGGKTPGFDFPATSADPSMLITGQPNSGSLDLSGGWVHMNADGLGVPFVFHRPLDPENMNDRSDSGDRTLEFFLKPRGTGITRGTLFWTNGDPADAPTNEGRGAFADQNRFRIDWGAGDEPVLDGNFAWFFSPDRVSAADGAISDRFARRNLLTMNEWNHVAIVRRDTGTHFEWTWFVNGNPGPEETRLTIREAPNAVAWTISGRPADAGTLDMVVDEIRFSSQALAPEHFLNAQPDANNPAPDATVAYYRFEEEAGRDIVDSVSGQVHGTIMDAATLAPIATPQPDAPIEQVYTGPIPISGTTTLRAVAEKEGYLPSTVTTQTYLFTADVIQQDLASAVAVGFPATRPLFERLDYEMDPDIVNHRKWGPQLEPALESIPTLSLVTDIEHLFDRFTGLYTNPQNRGRAWERPVSVELINPDGSPGFQIDAGIRIRGGISRRVENPKHSFRLFFRSEYGDPVLDFPLFGSEGVDEFKKVDLRTSQNYSWAFDGLRQNTFLRDVFSRDTQGALGQPYTRSRFYHLYINGKYWGLFQTQERSEAAYAESYFGGNRDDYDVVKSGGQVTNWSVEAADGNLDAYFRLHEASKRGFTDNEAYFRVQGMHANGSRDPQSERLLDVDNLIDFMLIEYFTGDRDGPGSRFVIPRTNNFYGIYNRTAPDGFKWFHHDNEITFDVGEENMVTPFVTHHRDFNESDSHHFNPHWLHEVLMENPEYRQRFADRAQKHFFHGGALAQDESMARLNERAATIETAIIAESARWGDSSHEPAYTRDDWLAAVARLRQSLSGRTNTVLSQFRQVGWLPTIDAPTFNQHGGAVVRGFQLTISNPDNAGAIYYTRDGTDPRSIGGSLAGGGVLYDGTPLTIDTNQVVMARVLHGDEWSAVKEAEFVVQANADHPGDANRDGTFDHDDILQVLAAGKFESGEPATFEEGDWDGDGFFAFDDMLVALASGTYTSAPSASADSGLQSTAVSLAPIDVPGAVVKATKTMRQSPTESASNAAKVKSSPAEIVPAKTARIGVAAQLADSLLAEVGRRGYHPQQDGDTSIVDCEPDWLRPFTEAH